MNYRSYEIHPPNGSHRDWHGQATLKDTDNVCASSQSDLYSQIDIEMNEYLETHEPFTLHRWAGFMMVLEDGFSPDMVNWDCLMCGHSWRAPSNKPACPKCEKTAKDKTKALATVHDGRDIP